MKVTLKDVANEVGVSTATVSIVINDPESTRVSIKTKQKILKTIKELNYIPNLNARSLASKASNSIGLVVPSVENPFFSTLIYNIEKIFNDIGYGLISSSSRNDFENELDQIERLVSRGIDGLMLATTAYDDDSLELLAIELSKYDLPIVLLDREVDGANQVQVVYDNRYGGEYATQYLINNGHKKIGIISAISSSSSGKERYLGYKKALQKNGILFDEKIVIDGDFDSEYGYEGTEKLIDKGVTAIFAANDLIAFGIIRKCTELGITIGEELSIIGYDNLEINEILDTGLTSMMQDIVELGELGTEFMTKKIKKENVPNKMILKPYIIERESVKNIKHNKILKKI